MALFGNKKTEKDSTKPVVKKEADKSAAVSMQDLYNGSTPKAAKSTGAKTSKISPLYQNILVKPVITEKATNFVAENKYAFMVAKAANKISVAKAVQALYSVKPVAVNILNRKGKKVSRGKIQGERSDSKIAVVTLAKGDSIKIYEGV